MDLRDPVRRFVIDPRAAGGCLRRFAPVALLALAGCGGSGEGLDENGRPIGEGDGGPLVAEFQSIQDHVFTPICTQCHAGAAAPEGMSLEPGRAYASLVGVASHQVPALLRVKPGDPGNSYLVHKISGTQEAGERMPRGLPPLPDATIAIIRRWIADGALPPATPVESAPHTVTALAGNGAAPAHVTDRRLVDPWGLAFGAAGPAWIANNGTATARQSDGTGTAQSRAIALPSTPTGIVANDTPDFVVGAGTASAPAAFIAALEDGTLAAWSPMIDPGQAVAVGGPAAPGARYTGLAMARRGGSHVLLAADFGRARIDVFDGHFSRRSAAAFVDPDQPAGYAPFGIHALGGEVVVTYALKPSGDASRPRTGAGRGRVNVFDTAGNLLRHLVPAGGALDAPWGLALAPPGPDPFAGLLLVGNFGDGRIQAFDPVSGRHVGALEDARGDPIALPGLWGLAFGNGAPAQPATTLFFTAGINGEADGLYGRIDPGATPPDSFTPRVALDVPAGDLHGTVTLTARANDDTGVVQVQFLADGEPIGIDTEAPYRLQWDTATVANGRHRLSALALDAAGNVGRAAETAVDVANATQDVTPPTVDLDVPAGDLHGTVGLAVTAHDDVGVVRVEYFADGVSIGASTHAPFDLAWATTGVANGAHTLTARARDAAGNAGDATPVSVTVANATLTQLQERVFGPICSMCHDGSDPQFLPGSMDLSTARKVFDETVDVMSEENPALQRILPGDPDNSYLIRKVEGAPGIVGERMPFGCPVDQACLDRETIDLMREWVSAGARNN